MASAAVPNAAHLLWGNFHPDACVHEQLAMIGGRPLASATGIHQWHQPLLTSLCCHFVQRRFLEYERVRAHSRGCQQCQCRHARGQEGRLPVHASGSAMRA